MSIISEWNKFINKIMWIWVWNSEKRKAKRITDTIIQGKNNKLIIFSQKNKNKNRNSVSGLSIKIKGNNNTIQIDGSSKFLNSSISVSANNSTIIIGRNSNYTDLNIHICCGDNQKVILGDNIRTFGVTANLNESNAQLIIKDNCLFSNNISIWPTDGHAIFDKETKQRINNMTCPTEIGEHCWIGENVKITKNTRLAPNTVVGIGSVVTKSFDEEYTAVAGNPAKVIKRNIIWDGDLYHTFDN